MEVDRLGSGPCNPPFGGTGTLPLKATRPRRAVTASVTKAPGRAGTSQTRAGSSARTRPSSAPTEVRRRSHSHSVRACACATPCGRREREGEGEGEGGREREREREVKRARARAGVCVCVCVRGTGESLRTLIRTTTAHRWISSSAPFDRWLVRVPLASAGLPTGAIAGMPVADIEAGWNKAFSAQAQGGCPALT